MSEHSVSISWSHQEGEFLKGRFSRVHTWKFDGGLEVAASASPSVVPLPYSSQEAVDPEEAFVASLASCHMLTFLFIASRRKFEVVRYEDHSVGHIEENEAGIPWVSQVVLRPQVEYAGEHKPTPEEEAEMHRLAHEQCFISNSVRTAIDIRPGSDTR